MSWKQQVVRRYDEPYQATSLSESKSLVIFGMAVARMERSYRVQKLVRKALVERRGRYWWLTSPRQNTASPRPTQIRASLGPLG
jgi:hypothetical protein